MTDEAITEDWLKEVGFKWHELERQNNKHWLLWLGRANKRFMSSVEDLGIEVASMRYENGLGDLVGEDAWFCWLRGDVGGRYSRFIHVRHISTKRELISLVEALTGLPWMPENHFYGSVLAPDAAERERSARQRLDRQILSSVHPWREIEKDDTRGRALPEHMEAHEKAKAEGQS